MNMHSPPTQTGSLLERAAALYGLAVPTVKPGMPAAEPVAAPAPQPEPEPARAPRAEAELRAVPTPALRPQARHGAAPRPTPVDRARLRRAGLLDPDAPGGPLAEEFRIVKRQLLAGMAHASEEKRHLVLVGSAGPDEGKTFCALNLALSLAGEKDVEVLLVDGDFDKPEILPLLGLEAERGFVDAIADPALDPEALVLRTDIGGLSVLGAGKRASDVNELLASERTREVLARLRERPNRIILFDSPPALAASSASVLASHVGQTVVVVRADRTAEADLREALDLLSACPNPSLLLNAAGFAASRRFGGYYGYGQ